MLTRREELVFRMIEEAADNGKVCPSNLDIEMALDCNSTSTAPNIIQSIEAKGYISVERFQRFRRVTIISTGSRTARDPRQKTARPHVPRGEGSTTHVHDE